MISQARAPSRGRRGGPGTPEQRPGTPHRTHRLIPPPLPTAILSRSVTRTETQRKKIIPLMKEDKN